MGQSQDPRPVLLIEDDDDTREAIQRLIELHGYTVKTATSVPEALRRLRGGLRPCVIILDIALGQFSGFDFRDQQLGDPTLADIPVIVESGIYDVKAAAKRLGAVDHFRKPFDVERIVEVLAKHAI